MEDFISIVEENAPVYNIRHRAFYFSRDIILYVGKQKYDKVFYSLFDQLVRSAGSIGANLVEGTAGSSKKDFINFYHIALKSANETKYWLSLIKETMDVDKENTKTLLNEASEIANIIAVIIIHAKQNKP